MNLSRYILACSVAFLFIFAFEWAFHGYYLQDLYSKTAHLWRTKDEMGKLFPWLVSGQFLTAFFLGIVFIKGYENKGVSEGLRFGLLMGLIFLPARLIQYAVAPYPPELIAIWIIGTFIELAIVGGIFSLVYKPKSVKVN